MMKFAVLFALLFVSTLANPFPFLGRYNNPYNLDTADDDDQGVRAQGGGAAQQNEPGDTPDDDQDEAAAGGQGAAPQAGTTIAPPAGDSSSSSSSSEEAAAPPVAPGGGATTAVPAGPIVGQGAGQAGQAGQGAGGAGAGDSSNDVDTPRGGPILEPQGQQPGKSSMQIAADPGLPNPLNMKQQAFKAAEGRRSGALIGLMTMFLVIGVASIYVVVYKYKDVIIGRLGI